MSARPGGVLAGLAWLGAAIAWPPAAAQTEGCNAPVQFDVASGGRLRRAKNPDRVILEGGARIYRCDQELAAPTIIGYLRDGNTLYRADVPDAARLTQAGDRLSAGWAVIDFDQDLATLGGGVTVTTQGALVQCQRLEADLEAGRFFCQGVTTPLSAELSPSGQS